MAVFSRYITDLFSMRSLLPFWTCWRETVGPHIMSLLQRKAEAENEVVVLRALRGDAELEAYYTRIGFTSRPQASPHEPARARMSPQGSPRPYVHLAQDFSDAGLGDSWRDGDLLYQ